MDNMEDTICIKITIYKGCHADEVIYYRNKLPIRIVSQWRWYFEYIAACQGKQSETKSRPS